MRLAILPPLTKKYVLDRVSQEEIFERYLGISVELDKRLYSPLRTDNHPTCHFYYNRNGKLKFRDFNGDFWGDCFDAVARVLGIYVLDKKGFNYVLHHVAKTFSIHKYKDNNEKIDIPIPKKIVNKTKQVEIIDIEIREWFNSDLLYWTKRTKKITPEILNYFKIFPCKNIWINQELKYQFKNSDPAYAYYLGKFKDGTLKFKIYFPYRDKLRFYTNNTDVQGFNQIFPNEIGIITKSMKDIVSLFTFGFTSIAPGGEDIPISPKHIWKFKSYTNYQVSLYDYDNAGIRGALKLKKQYGIQPIFLTDKLWNRKKGYKGAKDISDYCLMYGAKSTQQLIDDYVGQYQEQLDYYNQIYYNQLKPYLP